MKLLRTLQVAQLLVAVLALWQSAALITTLLDKLASFPEFAIGIGVGIGAIVVSALLVLYLSFTGLRAASQMTPAATRGQEDPHHGTATK